ncbi:hypothetical protein [Sphingomonas sp.]|uniref:hypothetical protein n=1 Tax=Sphingomonas sp. TaxID=28214 RepID=UPI0035C87842
MPADLSTLPDTSKEAARCADVARLSRLEEFTGSLVAVAFATILFAHTRGASASDSDAVRFGMNERIS